MQEVVKPTYEELVATNRRLANKIITLGDEFQQTLRTEIKKAKAEALNEVADQMYDRFTASWIRGKAYEIINGPHKPVGAFSTPESTREEHGDDNL